VEILKRIDSLQIEVVHNEQFTQENLASGCLGSVNHCHFEQQQPRDSTTTGRRSFQ